MAHEFEKGFSVRQPAWHGLATVLDEYPGREKAMELAGHNWLVEECPVWAGTTNQSEEGVHLLTKENVVKEYKALRRSDTGAVLAITNDTYGIVQNFVLWDVIDALMEQPNVKYETAGVLKGGRVIWVLARLDEPYTVAGDNSPTYPFVLCATQHDALGATKAQLTAVRVVCANTWKMAESEAHKYRYTFRHTSGVMARIDEAKKALTSIRDEFSIFRALTDELITHQVTADGVKEFLTKFIPDPAADVETPRIKRNIEATRDTIQGIINGETVPEAHRGDAYGLFLAGNEYLDHIRAYRTPETYFRRTMLESGDLKKRVAELALSV
jgi:phage/plasmid-like protein (TIGR03299 family)